MPNVIWDAFSPFAYFDMKSLYATYGQLIDGIIFFCIFLGIAKFTFQKRFPGRPGNTIAIALSFALTIGLLVAETTFGFSLKSFSGLAVGVILVITGFFIVTLSRSAGIGSVTSFALTYCLLYLSIASTILNLFDYIATRLRWLNGILGMIFLISLFLTLKAIATYFFGRKQSYDLTPSNPSDTYTDNADKELKLEENELKSLKVLRNKLRTVDDLIDALTMLEKSIQKHPILTPDQVEKARYYLHEISTKEEIFNRNHSELVRQFKQLGRIDSERLDRLQTELGTMPANLRKYKEAEIDIEKRKIDYDKRIIDIRTNLDDIFKTFHQNLMSAIQTISNDPDMATGCIKQAKDALLKVRNLINTMRNLQGELFDLHKTQRELMRGEKKRR